MNRKTAARILGNDENLVEAHVYQQALAVAIEALQVGSGTPPASAETRDKNDEKDHGAGLAAVGNDTGSSTTETASDECDLDECDSEPRGCLSCASTPCICPPEVIE